MGVAAMAVSKKGLGTIGDCPTSGPRLVAHRLVPDPFVSDAEFHERRRDRAGPAVGMIMVEVNLVEMIGGLARISGRSAVHELSAARLRKLWERAQIGGARAVDLSRVRVDTSGPSETGVLEMGEWARIDYAEAVQFLGMMRASLVERVVVHDQSLRAIAGKGRRAQIRMREALFAALDDLAVHFGLATRKGP